MRLDVFINGQRTIIEESPKVRGYVEHLYTRLAKEKRINRVFDSRKGMTQCDWQRIDMNRMEDGKNFTRLLWHISFIDPFTPLRS